MMRLLIDNMDGMGFTEYTNCLLAENPMRITRKLNEPSLCTAELDPSLAGLPNPVQRARVLVAADQDVLLFTGYVLSTPTQIPLGSSTDATQYAVRLSAISDEWILDELGEDAHLLSLGENAGEVIQTLTERQAANTLDASNALSTASLGVFEAKSGSKFSATVGSAAAAAQATYRVVNGSLNLQQVGSLAHPLGVLRGAVCVNTLSMELLDAPANDITLSGNREPALYVTEVFRGNGTTDTFTMQHDPFLPENATLVEDSFSESALDTKTWRATDPGSYLHLSSAGLALTGGNGFDGQTKLEFADDVEMGGTLIAEVSGISLNTGSDGVLCGFFSGPVSIANCVAGIRIRQSSGVTIAVALVHGTETGNVFTLLPGHLYTFRVRTHSPEIFRVLQTYSISAGSVQTAFGGGVKDSSLKVVCEVQDLGLASSVAATVLCDTTLNSSAAVCTFAPIDCVSLIGSVRSVRVVRSGSEWVTSRSAAGTEWTRLLGIAGEGVDATFSRSGVLRFFSGRVPAVGETVLVTYRTSARSVARMQDANAVSAAAASGLPGVSRWKGHVITPEARSSEDCESAVAALLSIAVDSKAALHGSCVADNLQQSADVWPGDLLQLDMGDLVQDVIVREVQIADTQSSPEALRYKMRFANEWAAPIGIALGKTLAADVPQPVVIGTVSTAPIANLPTLKVVSVSESIVTLDAGTDAPAGGGFEVRRRDGGFSALSDQDLVARSTVRTFNLPRTTQQESYFVRMYDGSSPPRYSRFSCEVVVTVPMG